MSACPAAMPARPATPVAKANQEHSVPRKSAPVFVLTAGLLLGTVLLARRAGVWPSGGPQIAAAAPTANPEPSESGGTVVRLAISKVILEKELALNRRFVAYLAQQSGRRFDLVHRRDYAGINRMIQDRETDFALVCGGPYVTCRRAGWASLVAIPQINGSLVYYSDVICKSGAPYKSIADFKGQRYAFADPLSNSGCIVPTYLLSQMETTPTRFFSKRIFTYSHAESVKAVREGFVEGASVDSYIYERLVQNDPALGQEVKVIQQTGPYGFTPIVAVTGVDPELVKEIQQALCTMHETPEGRAILQEFKFERFRPGEESLYDSIATMMDALAGNPEVEGHP